MNGKVERLRRELAEAEKEAGVPVSGEPVAWQYPYRHIISGEIVWTQTPRLPPAGYTSSHLAPTPLFTHPPHALSADHADISDAQIDAIAAPWMAPDGEANAADVRAIVRAAIKEFRQ